MRAENIRLDAKICIDFIYIEETPVLHVVDDTKNLSSAQFVDSLTTESVCETISTQA